MSKKKTETAATVNEQQYEILIPCHNDATGNGYEAGDIVTAADFEQVVIKNWLKIGVLKRVEEDGDSKT